VVLVVIAPITLAMSKRTTRPMRTLGMRPAAAIR